MTIDTTTGEGDDAAAGGKTLSEVMAAFGMKILRDWKGVGEANGDPIKFSEAALARFFNVPGTFEAMLRAYREATSGGKGDRAKN